MKKLKVNDFDDVLKKALKNKETKLEYDKLEEEYSLAKEFLELRMKSKMTQKELAEKAGTSQPAIARLESGSYKNLSLSFIRKVAAVLGAKPEIHLKSSN